MFKALIGDQPEERTLGAHKEFIHGGRMPNLDNTYEMIAKMIYALTARRSEIEDGMRYWTPERSACYRAMFAGTAATMAAAPAWVPACISGLAMLYVMDTCPGDEWERTEDIRALDMHIASLVLPPASNGSPDLLHRAYRSLVSIGEKEAVRRAAQNAGGGCLPRPPEYDPYETTYSILDAWDAWRQQQNAREVVNPIRRAVAQRARLPDVEVSQHV